MTLIQDFGAAMFLFLLGISAAWLFVTGQLKAQNV
jgi:hypothetical protein